MASSIESMTPTTEALESIDNFGDESDGKDLAEEDVKAPNYRRSLRKRISKESSLKKVSNKVIKKPEKRLKDKINLKPAEIKRLYINQKLTNFKPSNLETIFEDSEANDDEDNEVDSQDDNTSQEIQNKSTTRIFGKKKIRRALTCADGHHINKTLIKKRRSRIRNVLKKKYNFKKIPLTEFFEHLQRYSENSNNQDLAAIVENPLNTKPEILPNIDKDFLPDPIPNTTSTPCSSPIPSSSSNKKTNPTPSPTPTSNSIPNVNSNTIPAPNPNESVTPELPVQSETNS